MFKIKKIISIFRITPKYRLMGQSKRGKYGYNLMVAFDQLGNALAGGNPDVTISARIGYNTEAASIKWWIWIALKYIVNFTFFPFDGKDHCKKAYHWDTTEDYKTYNNYFKKGYWFFVILCSLIVIVFCLPISIIAYLIYATRLLKK